MEKFFVRRTNRGQHAPEGGFAFAAKVIRTKPDTALHALHPSAVGVIHFHHARVVEFLQDPWLGRPVAQGLLDRAGPVLVGQILPDLHAPRSPGEFGESADLEHQLTLLLAELFQLIPALDLQLRHNRGHRQRLGIHRPGPRDDFLQFKEVPVPQLPPPEIGQRSQPEERKPGLLLQPRLRRRAHRPPPLRHLLQDLRRAGYVRKVEEFEKPIHLPGQILGRILRLDHPRTHAGREPFHFRPVIPRLPRDEDVPAPGQSGESVDHSRPAQHVESLGRVDLVQPGGQSDASRHAVQLRDDEPGLGQNDIRPDDSRNLSSQGLGPGHFEQFRRLAPIEELRDPGRTLAREAQPVEQVARLDEFPQTKSQLLQILGQARRQDEWLRRHAPLFPGEEAALRHRGLDPRGAGNPLGLAPRRRSRPVGICRTGDHARDFKASLTNSSVPAFWSLNPAARTALAASTCL